MWVFVTAWCSQQERNLFCVPQQRENTRDPQEAETCNHYSFLLSLERTRETSLFCFEFYDWSETIGTYVQFGRVLKLCGSEHDIGLLQEVADRSADSAVPHLAIEVLACATEFCVPLATNLKFIVFMQLLFWCQLSNLRTVIWALSFCWSLLQPGQGLPGVILLFHHCCFDCIFMQLLFKIVEAD